MTVRCIAQNRFRRATVRLLSKFSSLLTCFVTSWASLCIHKFCNMASHDADFPSLLYQHLSLFTSIYLSELQVYVFLVMYLFTYTTSCKVHGVVQGGHGGAVLLKRLLKTCSTAPHS